MDRVHFRIAGQRILSDYQPQQHPYTTRFDVKKGTNGDECEIPSGKSFRRRAKSLPNFLQNFVTICLRNLCKPLIKFSSKPILINREYFLNFVESSKNVFLLVPSNFLFQTRKHFSAKLLRNYPTFIPKWVKTLLRISAKVL